MLKVEVCAFSGLKIYPGHGKRVTRADGKTQIFLNSKCERNHALKRNPRKVRQSPGTSSAFLLPSYVGATKCPVVYVLIENHTLATGRTMVENSLEYRL